MRNHKLLIGLVVLTMTLIAAQATVFSSGGNQTRVIETRFTVRIENISDPSGQIASDGTKWPFALSPGFWVVHEKELSLFAQGKRAGTNGLEAQAEDGNPSGLVKALMTHHASSQHGVFNMPVGETMPGPIGPGHVYQFSFTANPGMRLTVTTMFGQSNDLFYAPDKGGISLFDEKGTPVSGDFTARIRLWDAGTEVNQEPGVGADQAPRQKAPNTGMFENKAINLVKDKYSYPKTNAVMRVTITPAM